MFRKKTMPSLTHAIKFVLLYICFSGYYTYSLGIYFEVKGLNEMRVALNNATIVNALPCPTSYYYQVYVVKILDWCLPSLLFFACCMFCFINRLTTKRDNKNSKYDQFVISIVRRWTDFKDIIFSRHKEEIFIQQFK